MVYVIYITHLVCDYECNVVSLRLNCGNVLISNLASTWHFSDLTLI